MTKNKKITVSKREMLEEHKELVPKLRHAGLKKEAEKQEKELKSLKKR